MEVKWLMDDEAKYLDLQELYTEARDEIDRRYPRGHMQVAKIRAGSYQRWLDAHLFMEAITREVAGDWWERDGWRSDERE